MSSSEISKAFLLVTIPTHLRVMMEVASLLQASGRYVPYIVFHPSNVFDQNHENCVDSPHAAFIWKADRFLSKTAYLRKTWATQEKSFLQVVEQNHYGEPITTLGRLLNHLPHKGIYLRLLQKYPFLPSPTWLLGMVHRVWKIIAPIGRFCFSMARKAIPVGLFIAKWYGFMRAASSFLRRTIKILDRSSLQSSIFDKRPWMQRFLISAFEEEWRVQIKSGNTGNSSFRGRLTRLFHEGLFSGLEEHAAIYRAFSELLEQETPALLILPEENLFYHSHILIYAAQQKTIPSVVVPFTIANSLEWAEAFFNIDSFQANKGWNKIFTKAFPTWVLSHRGRKLILPPSLILSCEYLDAVPDQPWVINSGKANGIAAENRFMRDYYLRASIRPEKIRLTGTVADDKIYALLQSREQQRKTLAKKYAIEIPGKVILIALPPDQFPGGKRSGCEFDRYEELVRFMVSAIGESSAGKNTILINLHPRINRKDVGYLESLGATIIAEPIEQLVPLADIYVAVVSATIRLAISCGIPTVNYDAYHYNYDDYNNLPGVCEVNTRDAYANTVASLLHDEAFFSRVQTAQRDTANRLFAIDGKAGARLLALFDEFSSSKASAAISPDHTTSINAH